MFTEFAPYISPCLRCKEKGIDLINKAVGIINISENKLSYYGKSYLDIINELCPCLTDDEMVLRNVLL
jgi:hypothetical protein